MNTRLARWAIMALLLLGGLLIVAQGMLAAPALSLSGPLPEQSPLATQATTLTLSFSSTLFITPIGFGHDTAMVDLWDHTNYDGDKATLVYTATPYYGGIVNVQIVNSHYLSVTAMKTIEDWDRITIDVGDGSLADSAELRIEMAEPPTIKFRTGGLNDVPDPFPVVAGQPSTLTLGIGGDPAPLEYYASDDVITYSISNPPPSSTLALNLGIGMVVDTSASCSYAECHYITFEPIQTLSGKYPVWVEVQNSAGFTATDVFTVSVLQRVFLPVAMRNYRTDPYLHPIDNADGDGVYSVIWDPPSASDPSTNYNVAFSYNDPTFANAQVITTTAESQMGYFTWPGTHYWRVRAHYYGGAYSEWSNIQSTNVGAFAYLWINNDSYAFDMSVTVTGNGVNDTITYNPRTTDYWRSVPVGTYTFNIHNVLCSPDDRSETKSLVNTVAGGAWYLIDTCAPISGPTTNPPY